MTKAKYALTAFSLIVMFCNRLIDPLWGLSPQGFSAVCIVVGMMAMLIFVDMTWPFAYV